jgi:hypothetical protein
LPTEKSMLFQIDRSLAVIYDSLIYFLGGGELVHRLIFNEAYISEAALLPSSGMEGI